MLKKLLVLLCAFTVIAPAAAAQEEGVTVDPNSPSGKEYALPIDRARAQAAQADKKGSSPRKAPLFGEGVGGSAASAGGEKETPGAPGPGAPDSSGYRTPGDSLVSTPSDRAMGTPAAGPDGGLGVGASSAAGIAVLLIGGLIGLWLRRRATA